MGKKEKTSLPPTGAGLVRYFDEETTGPKISPEQVVALTVILGIFCFVLRFSL
ncbi:MAG: preprotein translocase subunit Sec61beta [Methanobacteriaceae archaeon]|nr:preprotein translocase subunit Sec61beta [Candidatus Methanorudis spinitermitis]